MLTGIRKIVNKINWVYPYFILVFILNIFYGGNILTYFTLGLLVSTIEYEKEIFKMRSEYNLAQQKNSTLIQLLKDAQGKNSNLITAVRKTVKQCSPGCPSLCPKHRNLS